MRLDGHYLFGLLLELLVHHGHVLVGELLDALLLYALLVLREFLVLVDGSVGILARVADGDAALLGVLLAVAHELLATLLGGLREGQADGATVV